MSDGSPFIPAWLDDADINIFERGVLVHIWRRGELFCSLQKTADHLQISKRALQNSLSSLVEKGLLSKVTVSRTKPAKYKPINVKTIARDAIAGEAIAPDATNYGTSCYSTMAPGATIRYPLKVTPSKVPPSSPPEGDGECESSEFENPVNEAVEVPLGLDQQDIEPPPDPVDEAFEVFWEQYPRQRRGNKGKARKAYGKAVSDSKLPKNEIIQQIQQGVMRYGASDEVARGFAAGCQRWLNNDGWSSDYKPVGQAQSSQQESAIDRSARKAMERIEREAAMERAGQGQATQGFDVRVQDAENLWQGA